MKFLKYLLYALVGLFVVYLILCAAGPKKMEVAESMTMNASPSAIWEEIADFSHWNQWSPWHKLDPNMKSTITGNPGEVGHGQSWVSSDGSVGTGSQKFSEVRTNEFLKSEMHFNGDTTHAAYASFTLTPDGEGTKVTWSMDGETPFMFRGMAMVMGMNKIIAEEYKKGLTDLKKIADAKPKGESVAFEIIDLQDQWYVGKMFAGVSETAIDSSMFSSSYMEIGKAIGGMEKMAGMPISISHNYNPTEHKMDLEIALPVAAEMKMAEGLNCGKIPAGKAAKYVYKGSYAGTPAAWGAFMAALTKEHKPRWSPYEVYANDPETVKNPDEFITWLIVPIE